MFLKRSNMDLSDIARRLKRNFDSYSSYRRFLIVLILFILMLLYMAPSAFRWLLSSSKPLENYEYRCISDRLAAYNFKSAEYDVNIRHKPLQINEKDFIPYAGNGFFGLEISDIGHINIKLGRSLNLPIFYHPLVYASAANGNSLEATVVEYKKGIIHKYHCFQSGYYISHEYYAHRTLPQVFVQDIKFTNPTNLLYEVDLVLAHISNWPTATTQQVKLQHGSSILDYQATTGFVQLPNEERIIAVSVVCRKLLPTLILKKRSSTNIELLMTIEYSEPILLQDYSLMKDVVERKAIDAMKNALKKAQHEGKEISQAFRGQHMQVWQHLWSTGFTISDSKAENSINGDQINATMYYVLSQTRSYEFEEHISQIQKNEISKSLSYTEGCYEGYHTLQADNLWKDLNTLENVNTVVKSWLLTLEKQGCHNLVKAGASGISQAMVLSFGGLRFSNQHLEFNIHPKYLHRDYHFRKLNYGNLTHLNISVVVRDDNKAVLYVAVDRADRNYYACDGGCMDDPIQLGPTKKLFPVKLTEPLTAILYITSDKQHMEDLKHAIHVKEVNEAPAHEHHVIALHKHGHRLGGLPTLFWVSICFLIIIFHVFLCKLIMTECCDPPDKYRGRYSKP
ncbi:uncharacterized protein KIAA2013 homolog [Ctenocephalides felis]|uniref:uncharacterized protein KIAA2013 homolog n=1 Tax=Ctenocephalides felis TaxID=7515 RepID=UPI000E6E1647|nr:uncharacterized protein KIAA2013 homolog [Ctenocephalides felis]